MTAGLSLHVRVVMPKLHGRVVGDPRPGHCGEQALETGVTFILAPFHLVSDDDVVTLTDVLDLLPLRSNFSSTTLFGAETSSCASIQKSTLAGWGRVSKTTSRSLSRSKMPTGFTQAPDTGVVTKSRWHSAGPFFLLLGPRRTCILQLVPVCFNIHSVDDLHVPTARLWTFPRHHEWLGCAFRGQHREILCHLTAHAMLGRH
mmetsp:Transcript_88082/g.156175  ORF Transcript_88082/g.156175 Transcript_88082/m.156175 type:complete len:202 (+) Transcript_88082:605-1210(+)